MAAPGDFSPGANITKTWMAGITPATACWQRKATVRRGPNRLNSRFPYACP